MPISVEERRKIYLLWLVTFFIYLSYSLGWNIVHTLFVKQLGIYYLPYNYIISSVLTIGFSSWYIIYANFIRRDILLIISLIGISVPLSIAYIVFYQLGNSILPPAFYAVLLTANGLIGSVLITQLWTIINEVFRPNLHVRIYPIIGTAIPVAGVLSGIIISIFLWYLEYNHLILFLSFSLLCTIPLINKLRKRYGIELGGNVTEQLHSDKYSFFNNITFFRNSSIMQTVSVILFTFGIIYALQDFQYTRIMDRTFSSEKDLGLFFSVYTILYNLTTLLFQLLFTEKIIIKQGLGIGLLSLPVLMFLSFLVLVFRFEFIYGLIMHYSWDLVSVTLMYTTYQISMNAIPFDIQGSFRGMLDGWINPLGSLVSGGVILFALNYFPTNNMILNAFGVGICAIWILFTLAVQKYFIKGLLDNLDSDNLRIKMNALDSVRAYVNDAVLKKMVNMLKNEREEVQSKILEIFSKIEKEAAIRAVISFIMNPSAKLRFFAITAIQSYKNLGNKPFLLYYLKGHMKTVLLDDPSPNVKAAAANFLLLHQKPEERAKFVRTMLRNPNPKIKVSIIETLSILQMEYLDFVLLDLIKDPNPQVRAAVASCLWKITDRRTESVSCLREMLTSDLSEENIAGSIAAMKLQAYELFPEISSLFSRRAADPLAYLLALSYISLSQEPCEVDDQACSVLINHIAKQTPYNSEIQDLRKLLEYCPDKVLDILMASAIFHSSQFSSKQKEDLLRNMQFFFTYLLEEKIAYQEKMSLVN
jgi:MFS family permease